MCRAYGAWGNLYITDPLLTEWANFCRASGAESGNRAALIFPVLAPAGDPGENCLAQALVNLPEQRFVFLRKWYREFHRKWIYTNTTR
jgi:hypothetical protein